MLKRVLPVLIIIAVLAGPPVYASEQTESGIYETDIPEILQSLSSNSKMSVSSSMKRWSSVRNGYIYTADDKIITISGRCGNSDISKKVYVFTYDMSFKLLSSKTIDYELESFGCFFSGENYNYIAFYQTNKEEDDNREVIRVVQYDKAFKRLAAVSVYGGEAVTTVPFFAGCGRMAEHENTLVLHMSRERYKSEDMINHQSQLTIIIDTKSMSLTDYNLGEFQKNHVSHSMNQFVRFDGRDWILVDHGDAYPRSVVLNKWDSASGDYIEAELLKIPGKAGANCTGVSVGGFEISSYSYIIAINSVDHSKVSYYDSYKITGNDVNKRDIYILASPKSNPSAVKKIKLTDYSGKNITASVPYIVKLSDELSAILWEEYTYEDSEMNVGCVSDPYLGSVKAAALKYVYINNSGERLTPVMTGDKMRLSGDCDPIVINGNICWFVDSNEKRSFMSIPVIDMNES